MSKAITILAPTASRLERAVATACAELGETNVPIRDLWNPDKCPVQFLPHLAWQFSVDRWDDTWPEATQRAAIKASYYIHRRKGTVAAVRRVVETLGYLIKIIEWWQTTPRGPRGTFALEIGVLDSGITDEMFLELERLIDDARPASRHLTGLAIHMEVRATDRIAVAAYLGDEMTIYPYSPGPISVSVAMASGARVHLADTLTIQPLNIAI